MKKPNSFSLTKVKLLKGGGLEATYREQDTVKGITDSKDWTVKNSINPHPDLVSAIESLKEYLAKCYGMDTAVVLSRSKGLDKKDTDAFKVVKKLIENVHNEMLKKIDITGIAISGTIENDKDKRSVIITGTQLMENNSKTALNSPRIKLNTDQFKFEADVQEIVDLISDEVAEYLFENKQAQLDMFAPPKEEKLSNDFIEGNIGEGKEDKKETKKAGGKKKDAEMKAA